MKVMPGDPEYHATALAVCAAAVVGLVHLTRKGNLLVMRLTTRGRRAAAEPEPWRRFLPPRAFEILAECAAEYDPAEDVSNEQ